MKKVVPLFLVAIMFSGMLGAGLALKYLARPQVVPETLRVNVDYGDSVKRVASKLNSAGVLEYPDLWVGYVRLMDLAGKIKAGEYDVNDGDSPLLILDNMIHGRVVQYSVTLVEGWTLKEALVELHSADGLVETLEPGDDVHILKAIGAEGKYQHAEGLIYPETYHYTRGDKDRDVLRRGYTVMQETLADSWPRRVKDLPLETPYDALILASIIEKETAVDSERRQIAGVFVERLKRGMRLQTDPTVIYGMGDNYKGNIRLKDLRTPTPYNTYTISGLPPTPIALPSKESIDAALDPLLNGKLYFVAKGDGSHAFSKTLAEHNSAVREYQLKRKKNYRSTPE
ncbi:Endolytic murein transglycosylase [BD1-7 clade bacterium]|uniref:Endolytic murein transglycosylase n=1 Tax=BD1-7 clade bacterium TaxID=2029982 RepID=A0A5S9PXS8_9GAMM|nr:Endolytic murein transglycosylase [BD1-7 clade bacterium]CAA0109286.1 Endolytic murein transglycosylase [BD1-7 clade bacterium]